MYCILYTYIYIDTFAIISQMYSRLCCMLNYQLFTICKYRDASVTFAVTVRRPQWRDFELKLEKVCTVRALPLR